MIRIIKRIIKNIGKLVLRDIATETSSRIDVLKKRGLKIGENCNIQHGCIIDDSHCWHIEIGNDVTLAPRVHILAHDTSTKKHLNYTKVANVKIEDKVFIGAGAIILPGVVIGKNSIIGAGSVISKNIPENSVVIGNPAIIISNTQDYLNKHKKNMNINNMFDESYTIRENIDDIKKNQMKKAVEEKGGYVM